MKVVIRAKKVKGTHGDAYLITGFHAMFLEHLPGEYLAGFPRCYIHKDHLVVEFIVHGDLVRQAVQLNSFVYPPKFDELIKQCRLAGERLHEIRTRIYSPEWAGEVEEII